MLIAWLSNACCLYSKTAAKASKNQPAIAYQNSSTSSPPSQSTATAAAASSGYAIDIYLHTSTGVYEMIDDVPTSSTPETAAVYGDAGVSVDKDKPYAEPNQLFDNDLYVCELKPSTEVSDVPDGQTH